MNLSLNHFVPQKRKGVITRQIQGELLVFDPESNKAHCLNAVSARVWQLCDGKRTVAQITHALKENPAVCADDGVIWLALRQLKKAGLLSNSTPPPLGARRLSRREAGTMLGKTALLVVPLISSVVVPTPAEAASCLPCGSICLRGGKCCSPCTCGVQGINLVCL
jgi:Coenzyme PQQ synthesis protein D (PqqD)